MKDRKILKDLNLIVRDWYVTKYPKDADHGQFLRKVTFRDVAFNIRHTYDILGDHCDSVIRERVFEKLAEIFSCPYDDILDAWVSPYIRCKTDNYIG